MIYHFAGSNVLIWDCNAYLERVCRFEVIEKKMRYMLDLVKKPYFGGGYGEGNYRRYLRHYKTGLIQTREFLNFYNDNNNNT